LDLESDDVLGGGADLVDAAVAAAVHRHLEHERPSLDLLLLLARLLLPHIPRPAGGAVVLSRKEGSRKHSDVMRTEGRSEVSLSSGLA
jgi:hypothetical protein